MHELSLCQAIADVVRPYAADKHIDVVRVQVGALRQVVPDSLTFCWELIRDYESRPDAELELELVPAEVVCRACGRQSPLVSRWAVCCPTCDSGDVKVIRGDEFQVTSMDVS